MNMIFGPRGSPEGANKHHYRASLSLLSSGGFLHMREKSVMDSCSECHTKATLHTEYLFPSGIKYLLLNLSLGKQSTSGRAIRMKKRFIEGFNFNSQG